MTDSKNPSGVDAEGASESVLASERSEDTSKPQPNQQNRSRRRTPKAIARRSLQNLLADLDTDDQADVLTWLVRLGAIRLSVDGGPMAATAALGRAAGDLRGRP
jgi:hypothetical protein